MLKFSITFIGLSKSGKSSIIDYIFNERQQIETMSIEPTKTLYSLQYQNQINTVTINEIPGSIKDIDQLETDYIQVIKTTDIFIFIHDLKNEQINASINYLQNYYKKIVSLNKNFFLYTFYHQCDLDYIYVGSWIEDVKNIFYQRFKKYVEQNFQNSLLLLNKYSQKVTSIYDESINFALSDILTNYLNLSNVSLSKLLTEVTKQSKIKNLLVFDVKLKICVAKDDIPLDLNTFSQIMNFLELFYQFKSFYKDIENQSKIDKEDKLSQSSELNLSSSESFYIFPLKNNLYFFSVFPEGCIEYKKFIDHNLSELAKIIIK